MIGMNNEQIRLSSLEYHERMERARVILNAFKETPAWKPYTDGEAVYMATYDPYTESRYGEPAILRWSIYWGNAPKKPDDTVSLYHDRTDGGRYFDTLPEAQTALDKRAEARGWRVIPKPPPEEAPQPEPEPDPQPTQGELAL